MLDCLRQEVRYAGRKIHPRAAAFEFGCQVEQSWDISSVARPYMEHLAQRTGASVVLSICESGSVITLDQVQPRSNLHVVSNVGALEHAMHMIAAEGH